MKKAKHLIKGSRILKVLYTDEKYCGEMSNVSILYSNEIPYRVVKAEFENIKKEV